VQIAENDPSCTNVDLSNQAAYQCRPDDYTGQIANAIKNNKYLKQLNLEGDGLGDREAAALAEGLAANTSITVLDLKKNRINNDGGSALAKGIAKNSTLVEINLMNQPSRWGDQCLDDFLAMFDTNITLLKITWRLESRKSFALNKMITRNNEIDRRKKNGMVYNDLLPTALKGTPGSAEGKENIPAHKPADPLHSAPAEAAPIDSSTQPAAPVAAAEQPKSNGASSSYQQTVSSASSAPPAPKSPRAAAPAWAGGQGSKFGGAGGAGEDPKPGVPKVRKALPSVLSRWPPAQNNE